MGIKGTGNWEVSPETVEIKILGTLETLEKVEYQNHINCVTNNQGYEGVRSILQYLMRIKIYNKTEQ